MQKKSENECKEPILLKQWYFCPICKKKLLLYKTNAHCEQVFIKCKKCGNEVEVRINS